MCATCTAVQLEPPARAHPRAMLGDVAMSSLTIRLPDQTAARLKKVAQSRGLSMNKLIEEMSTQAIAAFDAELRFRALVTQGDCTAALAVLDRLNKKARRRNFSSGPNWPIPAATTQTNCPLIRRRVLGRGRWRYSWVVCISTLML